MGELEPPDDPERLEADAPGHLRLPRNPIHEEDRHLADGEPAPPRPIGGLDLEGVAVGAHAIGGDRRERLTPPAFEPAGGVAYRHSGHRPHVPVAEVADE